MSPNAVDLPRWIEGTSTLVVAAHPDDETIGAGALLSRSGDVRVLTVTDGAPADHRRPDPLRDPERVAHAARRRDEVLTALAIAGLHRSRWHGLALVDQAAPDGVDVIVAAVVAAVRAHGVRAIVTHAYEGGHPDHDAVAVAVHAAAALLDRDDRSAPEIVEMALYHGAGGAFTAHAFVGDPGLTHRLTPAERDLKRRMLDAHASQRDALTPFSCDVERFRLAPRYDFRTPPHPGPLLYETQRWGWTAARFGEAIGAATARLGLGAPPWR